MGQSYRDRIQPGSARTVNHAERLWCGYDVLQQGGALRGGGPLCLSRASQMIRVLLAGPLPQPMGGKVLAETERR